MNLTIKLQTAQKLQLSQNQIQSLEILRMDSMELQDFMQNEYLENPMLDYAGNQDAVYGPDDISSRYEHNITYGKTYEEIIEDDDKRRRDLPDIDPDQLRKALLYQLPYSKLSAQKFNLLNYMIDALDETGFFTMSLDEVARQTNTKLCEVEDTLHTLQQLEPHGLFAADLRECLLIQLRYANMEGSDTWNIVDQHLEDVANGRISVISRSLSLSTAQVRKCIEQIARLNPRPMNALADNRANKYIIPDIILKKEHGKWEIELNDRWIENYRINDYYVQLMNESHDEELRAYFKSRLDRVLFIQNSIRQRRQTMLCITEAILSHQASFLENKSSLVPMTMQAIADELSMHPSTISRAIRGKHMQCPQGTLSLRSLFSSAVSESKKASGIGAAGIKDMIRRIIEKEDKHSPLSDQKILSLLKEEGITISRRAVAQYRESLGIKSSYERKCTDK